MGNATELTITKAKSGVAVSNVVTMWKSTAKAAEISQDTTMGVTGALGKHPSTVTYGWTVTKLDAAGITGLDDAWVSMVKSTAAKPFILYASRSSSHTVVLAEKALTITSGTAVAVGK